MIPLNSMLTLKTENISKNETKEEILKDEHIQSLIIMIRIHRFNKRESELILYEKVFKELSSIAALSEKRAMFSKKRHAEAQNFKTDNNVI